jgi:ABC-2 type transport system permease protein
MSAIPEIRPARWIGFRTLLYKEVLRFWKVSFQTVAAPVLTALLYLLIFGHVLEDRVKVFDQLSYTAFLVPGLVMMSVLQNAFANSSSSLIQSKITGNLVFIMLPPLSHWEMFGAYVTASVIRGLAVGTGVLLVTTWFAHLHFAQPLWIIVFAVLGAAVLGTLGLIAGIWAEKFDQLAAFQNFLIVPGGRVLFDPFTAAILAGGVPRQPVLLHDRRLPLRLLRRVRCAGGDEPRRDVDRVDRGGGDCPADAAHGLQTAPLMRRQNNQRRTTLTFCRRGTACCPHPNKSSSTSKPACRANTSKSRATVSTSSPPSSARSSKASG